MKKTVFLIFINLFAITKSQYIGINTSNPSATLDLVGNPTNITTADGLIAPRITLSQLNAKTSYSASQEGSLIYITDISGSTTTATALVTNTGYYYFNGSVWQPVVSQSGNVIFSATLGSGDGGATNANINANVFSTIPLTTVTKNTGGGIWSPTDNTFSVPNSGTYLIKSSIRLTDGSTERNFYQAVNTSNSDIPEGVWQTNYGNRWTMLYTRIAYFNKNDLLRLYIYSDGSNANISDASLNIVQISQN